MKNETLAKSIHFCNVETLGDQKNIHFVKVDGETDEITSSLIEFFPVESQRVFFEMVKTSDQKTARYWKFYRAKELIFDVLCLSVTSIDVDLVTGMKEAKLKKNLFDHSLEPVSVKADKKHLSISHTLMNIYEAGNIIDRCKGNERNIEAFTNAAKKFFEVALFAPRLKDCSNEELLKDYENMLFI